MADTNEPDDQEAPLKRGAIRIRSNICTQPNAWHLVPGDLIQSRSLPRQDLTDKQREEMMYYERCCYCHRTIYEIEENGCDNTECRDENPGMLSTSEARSRRNT